MDIGFQKYYLLVIILFLSLIIPVQSYSACAYDYPSVSSLSSDPGMSRSLLNLTLSLLATLVVICCIIILFSIKLNRVNKELQARNIQILDINEDLRRSNEELARQKETIKQEHYESDMFYGMLVQSANDGISFYDRAWNLKYTNAAFYSMIGLDKTRYDSINPEELIHPDDREYETRKNRHSKHKGVFEGELQAPPP